MKYIDKFLHYLIDTRLFISIAAVCSYLSTVQIVPLAFDWYYLFFVFACTWSVYLFPFAPQKGISQKRAFWLGFGSLFALGVFSFVQLRLPSGEAYIIALVLAGSTISYYLPFLSNQSLRNVPFLKIFLIAFCWTLATVTLPVSAQGHTLLEPKSWWLTIERFVFIFAITVPFDIRDMQEDSGSELQTLPMLIGVQGALILSGVLLFAYLVMTYINYGSNYILLARLIVVSFAVLLLRNVKPERQDHFYTGLFDGTMVLQCVLLYALA